MVFEDELFVEGADVLEPAVGFFFAFLAGLGFAFRAGSVPPTSTPDTAAGGATWMLWAFTPAPAVSVFDPPDLASPKAAANAATTATRPMARERVSMGRSSTFSRAARGVSLLDEYVA